MKLGLATLGHTVHQSQVLGSRPDDLEVMARLAESAGFESVWVSDHVVLPSLDPGIPMTKADEFLDPILALTWAAAATSRIRLATGILILPQRNPVVLAKQLASLDVLSQGRLELGIGVGYLEAEFEAIGANFKQRGAVADEYLDAMKQLWYAKEPFHEGRFVSFSGVDAYPRPIQQPIPINVGGHSMAAYRRAVARGHGWYGCPLTPGAARHCLAGLRKAADTVDRPAALGDLEITVTPPGHPSQLTERDMVAYAEMGVQRIVVMPGLEADAPARVVEATLKAASVL